MTKEELEIHYNWLVEIKNEYLNAERDYNRSNKKEQKYKVDLLLIIIDRFAEYVEKDGELYKIVVGDLANQFTWGEFQQRRYFLS